MRPTTSRSLDDYYHINGSTFEKQYNEVLSGYRQWSEFSHADEWLVFPKNIGKRLCIDETAISDGELYAIVSNPEARGGGKEARYSGKEYSPVTSDNGDTRKQLLARSRFLLFKPSEKWTQSQKLHASILFQLYPDIKEAYSLTHSLRMIFNKNKTKDESRLSLARWYDKVYASGFRSFNVIASTMYEHYDEVLNFFNSRSTNAFAESFNAKIKHFRAQLRGVIDIKFFFFRLMKLYV